MSKSTTENLSNVLKTTGPDDFSAFREENEEKLLASDRPFRDYMAREIDKNGLRRQTVFLNADISEGYGYKLLSEEKHTVRRDVILRLCLGAKFSPEQTNRALALYGMAPLYPRLPRDALLISAIAAGVYDVHEIDALLTKNGFDPLYACK